MFFMGNGYMNSDWGMMGGYPSGAGYRFEAHKTGLKERIAKGQSLPLGSDGNPDDANYEKHISRSAKVKRDQQCMTTEDCYDNYDLYLNYLRGGPGFGDPIDREPASVEADLNGQLLLPEFAEKVYGAVCSQDDKGVWHVDAQATAQRRAEMRKERIARSQPVKDWMKQERERILRKDASVQVQHMYASSFGQSAKFLEQFRSFWSLPPEWNIVETELGVPTYGAKFRMDLSKLPDVTVVTLVEE